MGLHGRRFHAVRTVHGFMRRRAVNTLQGSQTQAPSTCSSCQHNVQSIQHLCAHVTQPVPARHPSPHCSCPCRQWVWKHTAVAADAEAARRCAANARAHRHSNRRRPHHTRGHRFHPRRARGKRVRRYKRCATEYTVSIRMHCMCMSPRGPLSLRDPTRGTVLPVWSDVHQLRSDRLRRPPLRDICTCGSSRRSVRMLSPCARMAPRTSPRMRGTIRASSPPWRRPCATMYTPSRMTMS